MVENNLWLSLAISLSRIHGRPVHGVSARWIAAVRPVDRAVGKIEFGGNRVWPRLVEKFDAFAIAGSLALANFEMRSKDPPLAGVVRPLLSAINFPTFDVER